MDAELRATMRQEIAEMVEGIDRDTDSQVGAPIDVEQAIIRRRMRHAGAALITILDAHPADDRGRCATCKRRSTCPADALLQSWAEGWLGTGGLATRRDGDLRMVSSRRLA